MHLDILRKKLLIPVCRKVIVKVKVNCKSFRTKDKENEYKSIALYLYPCLLHNKVYKIKIKISIKLVAFRHK